MGVIWIGDSGWRFIGFKLNLEGFIYEEINKDIALFDIWIT